MRYLIDGYNLLHAIGLLRGRAGPTGLEQARARLLGILHGALGEQSGDATVVFDSGRTAPDFPHEQEFQGVQVRFSYYPDKADDLIAELIRRDSAPRGLAVVSDDREVQRAGRRRQCAVLTCMAFMTQLERLRRKPKGHEPSEKEATLSEKDLNIWLAEFAELDESPDLRELAEPKEFWDQDPAEESD